MRGQSVRRTCVGLLAACAVVLGSSATASATPLSYSFDSDNQDWTQNQDQASMDFLPAGFQSTEGNPGGHLQAWDRGPENGCPGNDPCELLTFYSPIVTPLSANYDGLASFDLRSPDADPQFAAELLLLAGGDNYLDGLSRSPQPGLQPSLHPDERAAPTGRSARTPADRAHRRARRSS